MFADQVPDHSGRVVLRREMSSPAQTLGSWVRISLETWMYLRVSSLFALSRVALRQGWSPVQVVLPTVSKIHSSWLILKGNRPEGLTQKVEEVFHVRKILANLWNALSFWGIQNARLHIRGERKIMAAYFKNITWSLLLLIKWNKTS
jgi:hypothetical protein